MSQPVAGSDGRDRDAAGRARNARPRDALGRPLARNAVGYQSLAGQDALPPGEAVQAAQDLLDSGRPFDAHEVLEATWKAAPAGERDLWQGLAQVAVGLTHARRGNARGAATLLSRGAARLAAYEQAPPYGIDVPGVRRRCAWLAEQVTTAGLDGIPQADLTVRLTAG